ncbi:MAG: EAL domain-containing protein [Pseudomonadota bacterium]|nr:EAL domain-containing protein [Pseudomonadota bacterium]
MLTGTYNAPLVVFSFLVASIAAYTALDMAARINASRGTAAGLWWAGGSLAMGCGIWSMHFIGMLAFSLPIPLGYDITITFISLLIAVGSSGCLLWLMSADVLPWRRLLLGAVVIGLGIAGMHYLGMVAMKMQPGIEYDALWFTLSILIAIAAAGAALWIAFALKTEGRRNRRLRLLAALVMGLAIVGMHYTGMAAARFPLGSICGAAQSGGISQHWLAILVGTASFGILALALLASLQERRMQERTRVLADSLTRANQELSYLALHDSLTKLPNRLMLETQLDRAIARAERHGCRFAVFFIDLDGFKPINDAYGHPVGDRMLMHLANELNQVVRAEDTLARMGGDEFVVISEVEDSADAARLAERLLRQISIPMRLGRGELHVTASIGIAMHGDDGTTGRDLIAHADAAMYAAKENGRNEYCFFAPSMNRDAHAQLALIQDLRGAIAAGQLRLHYQPKHATADGRLVGVEALLRWQHPERGLLLPEQVIPLAEKTGLILEIGGWVIEEACRHFMAVRHAGQDLHSISINLSPSQFRSPGLIGKISGALGRHQMPASALMIEITESTAMRDPETTLDILGRLVALGVKISIDDFGSGYSSLMYLKRLPACELKIDQGFIHDLCAGSEDEAIVAAIIALGHTLNLTVIAEGVETEEQQAVLTRLGCDSLQGFLFGKPVPSNLI